MDRNERTVAHYLAHRGYTDVRYEPDGNIPPDFLVDGRIAVEARMLNQHHLSNGQAEGLEDRAVPLTMQVANLLKSFGPPAQGGTWFVRFHFSRPIEKWKGCLEPKIVAELKRFRELPVKTPMRIKLSDRFELEFMLEGEDHGSLFLLGSPNDEESAGYWVLSELYRNLPIVVSEKTRKIAAYRNRYPEWWLVLVDTISFGLGDPTDQRQFREMPALVHNWDKVVLVNPQGLDISFEV